MSIDFSEEGLSTIAVHGGVEADPSTGAIVAPICQSTTYVQAAVGRDKGHTYSRASNPTVCALERALGALEGAPPAVAFSTGLAAETALFLSLLRAGDHVVIGDAVYGGTVRLAREVLSGLGIESTFVDSSRPEAVERAIRPETGLVFVETPANPTLKLTDIRTIAGVARRAKVPLAVDNTFLTPALLRPLDLGADVSLLSTTKFIEGHNTTVGGSIASRDERLLERLRFIRRSVGSIQTPFAAWLTLRGLKTLPLRMRRHSESALRIAEWLEAHDEVERVAYPGLASFPQRELAGRQHGELHGGVIAFEVRGGAERAVKVMNTLRRCSLAESLGAVETLVTHPVSMTHGDVPHEQREAAGIGEGLIRLSVGLEEPEDIIADLARALAASAATKGGAAWATA